MIDQKEGQLAEQNNESDNGLVLWDTGLSKKDYTKEKEMAFSVLA